jgi:cell division protease FtsH
MSTPNAHPLNSSDPPRQSDSGASPPLPPQPRRTWLPFVGVGTALLLLRTLGARGTSSHVLSYSGFLSQVQSNHIRSAVINPAGAVSGTLTSGTGYTSQIPAALPDPRLPVLLRAHHVAITGTGTETSIGAVIVSLLPLLLFVAFFVWIGRRGLRQAKGGIIGIGGSKAKLYDEERPSTGFADVAGYEAAKREVSEVVDFLKHPEKYAGAGATGPRGVLMVGPPGTGKTLLA